MNKIPFDKIKEFLENYPASLNNWKNYGFNARKNATFIACCLGYSKERKFDFRDKEDKIKEMYLSGFSYRKIAAAIGTKNYGNLSRYIGKQDYYKDKSRKYTKMRYLTFYKMYHDKFGLDEIAMKLQITKNAAGNLIHRWKKYGVLDSEFHKKVIKGEIDFEAYMYKRQRSNENELNERN